MTGSLATRWWFIGLRGGVYLGFGLSALLWPQLTFGTLVLLFGLFSLLDGVVTLGASVRAGSRRKRWRGMALEGLLSSAVGLVVLFWPDISGLALLYLIAAWALVTGVLELAAAVRLRREIEGEWLLGLNGVLSIAFGSAVFLWPASGALAIVWILGIYALLFSVVLFALAIQMWRHVRAATA